jgi:hypothetical protein
LLNSHLAFLVFLGFGTIGSKSIGYLALIAVPEEETLAINKDLLLPSCSLKEGCNKILVFVIMDLELKEGLMGTKEKICKLVPSFVVKIDFIFYHKINQKGFKIK